MPDGGRVPNGRSGAAAGAAGVPGHVFQLVPNAITFARLCAVPAAVWLVLRSHTGWAFFVFAAAGISDAIDGALARRLGPTHIGALLDPLADKALLVSMYVTLAAVDLLPDWLAILVVFRDLLIVGGVIGLSMLGHKLHIRPLLISKVNTALQILLVGLVLLLSGFGLSQPPLVRVLTLVVAGSTLLSGAAYVRQAARMTGGAATT
jgi:cardiolipin synthase